MKTAISIPDRVFRAAERAAKRQKVSRSHFYSQAIEAYLKTQKSHEITSALNAVYGTENSELDPDLASAAYQLLAKEKW